MLKHNNSVHFLKFMLWYGNLRGKFNPLYLCYFHGQITLKIFNLLVCFIGSFCFAEVFIRINVQNRMESIFKLYHFFNFHNHSKNVGFGTLRGKTVKSVQNPCAITLYKITLAGRPLSPGAVQSLPATAPHSCWRPCRSCLMTLPVLAAVLRTHSPSSD